VPADWAFVSGVSPVSPNLKLIHKAQEMHHGRALVGAPPLALRQVRLAQSPRTIVVRQHGRDADETGGTAYRGIVMG